MRAARDPDPDVRCESTRIDARPIRRFPGSGSLASFLLVLLAFASASPGASAEGLQVHPEHSSDGVYQLSWDSSGEVVIEESRDGSFEAPNVVYRGPDQAATLTGRPDGRYFYRLRSLASHRVDTESARVIVQHHPLSRALAFFTIGLLVFTATVVLVLRGAESEGTGARAGLEAIRRG